LSAKRRFGVAWRFRTGCPWRDVPAEFGPWQTPWKRHRRWPTDGTYQRIFEHVQESQDRAGRLDCCCRSTRRSCAPTSTPPGRPRTAQGPGRMTRFRNQMIMESVALGWLDHQDPRSGRRWGSTRSRVLTVARLPNYDVTQKINIENLRIQYCRVDIMDVVCKHSPDRGRQQITEPCPAREGPVVVPHACHKPGSARVSRGHS
jgi:hypothetical protein